MKKPRGSRGKEKIIETEGKMSRTYSTIGFKKIIEAAMKATIVSTMKDESWRNLLQ